MICGTDPLEPVPDFITNSGFGVADSLVIIGFKITKNWQDINENLDKAEQNIDKQIRFWDRYRLSLPGRINVAKTLLLPQISYHASIIPLSADKIEKLQEKINGFVTGKMRLAKNLITAPLELGGLGFINLKNFIMSFQCSWIKRAANNTIDNWRLQLHLNTGGNPLSGSPDCFSIDLNPILHGFSDSLFKLKECFYLRNDNFLESYLLGNPCLLDVEKNWLKDDIWLGEDNEEYQYRRFLLSDVKIKDIVDDNCNLKPRQAVCEILRTDIPVPVYNTMTAALDRSKKIVHRKNLRTLHVEAGNIAVFLKQFKKGSKPIRKIFEYSDSVKIKPRSATRTKTFFNLIGLEVPCVELLKKLNLEWSQTCYPVKL
jgi:hypothetical protein